MRDVFIGIDLGTTVLKAAAFDGRTGKALAVAGRRLPVETGSGTGGVPSRASGWRRRGGAPASWIVKPGRRTPR